jgi:hypothetical protein
MLRRRSRELERRTSQRSHGCLPARHLLDPIERLLLRPCIRDRGEKTLLCTSRCVAARFAAHRAGAALAAQRDAQRKQLQRWVRPSGAGAGGAGRRGASGGTVHEAAAAADSRSAATCDASPSQPPDRILCSAPSTATLGTTLSRGSAPPAPLSSSAPAAPVHARRAPLLRALLRRRPSLPPLAHPAPARWTTRQRCSARRSPPSRCSSCR